MINYGGFEGNAQTLRILTRLEKKIIDTKYKVGFDNKLNDHRVGLNLCSRTIASILKYDNIIPIKERKKYAKKYSDGKVKPVKGYYESEKEYVDTIITNICSKRVEVFKSIECQIMDIADDIAYSTYDLEDGLKAGFYNPLDLIYAPEKYWKE